MFKRSNLSHVIGLKCVKCQKTYNINEISYTCSEHEIPGNLDFIYNYDLIKKSFNREFLKNNKDFSMWRYKSLYPILQDNELSLPIKVGWTPLYKNSRLEKQLGLKNLFIKDDGRNPTGSLKDRASALGIIEALMYGESVITAASTGNAASSLSGLSASIGIKNVIFVPKTAPVGKIAQLQVFGAKLLAVDGTYDEAFDLCFEVSKYYGYYLRNTGVNPILSEGKKSVILEICEQLNWNVPDKIYVPVGDGCIIGGVYKGLYDFYKLGIIERIPQIIGVQAEGSSAILNAWKNNDKVKPIKASTIADSISVSMPRDSDKALNAVKKSNGEFINVSDSEILSAIKLLGNLTGVFAEPAGVASLAGLIKHINSGKVNSTDHIVLLITGNGLKDVESAIKATGNPIIIKPSLDEVINVLTQSL